MGDGTQRRIDDNHNAIATSMMSAMTSTATTATTTTRHDEDDVDNNGDSDNLPNDCGGSSNDDW